MTKTRMMSNCFSITHGSKHSHNNFLYDFGQACFLLPLWTWSGLNLIASQVPASLTPQAKAMTNSSIRLGRVVLTEARGAGVQGHLGLHSQLESSLCCMRPRLSRWTWWCMILSKYYEGRSRQISEFEYSLST